MPLDFKNWHEGIAAAKRRPWLSGTLILVALIAVVVVSNYSIEAKKADSEQIERMFGGQDPKERASSLSQRDIGPALSLLRRVSIVVAEHPAETFAAGDGAGS